MKELLRIRDLYTENTHGSILNDFRLQVFSSEIMGLVGLNGSGKSTLAGILSGETAVRGGVMYFNGTRHNLESQKLSRFHLEQEGIYVIRNETRLIQNLNIEENMSISMKRRMSDLLKNPGKKEILARLILKEFFPGLNPKTDACDLPLSVHWKIGILKVYLEGAKLIVLDRIFDFCSEKEQQNLIRFIKKLRQKKTSFIITYNKVASFLHVFDRIAVVRSGRLSGVFYRGDYDLKLIANLIIGREYADSLLIKREEVPFAGSRILEIRKSDTGNLMDGISLKLHSGEILGIYDPLLEKSVAMINMLSGTSLIRRGSFFIENEAARAGIGIVSEKNFDKLFFSELTAGQNLLLSAAKRSSGVGGWISHSVEKYLEQQYPLEIGIPEHLKEVPVRLIGRDLQFILVLHMRILSGARIFILENPLRGADLLTRRMVYQKIKDLRKKGKGVIFISTDNTELEGFCDRVIQFDKVGIS